MCYTPNGFNHLAKIDVNDYIIKQMKRKLEPFFIRNHKKKQTQAQSLLTPKLALSPPARLDSANRISEASTLKINEPGIYNKIKSQTIRMEKTKIRDSLIDLMPTNERLEILRAKVQNFIDQKRKRIMQKQYQAQHETCQCSQNQLTFHRKIVTTLSKPFDYSKIQAQMKKNLQSYRNSELETKISLEKEGQQQKNQKQKGDAKENKAPKRSNQAKKNKKSHFHTSRNRKSSFFEIESLKDRQDEIDLQFQEGLVEEIYSPNRIKFRNKINQTKSRKNIYDGSLYFLKQ